MSIQIASLGTNYESYYNNWDRNGGWANYLQQLSLLNNHDRQIYNGEFNTRTGMHDISFASPFDNHPIKNNLSGHEMKDSFVKPVNFKVDTDQTTTKRKRVQRMKKIGLNPRYLGATGV
jgi:hypothetical protein